ncbi:TPA: hypothetical protein HA244_01645 [Candidatus Micrarchaeota archaeon]|nr:hypothetical protein [Candidatus Micrarchaeota archaeon]
MTIREVFSEITRKYKTHVSTPKLPTSRSKLTIVEILHGGKGIPIMRAMAKNVKKILSAHDGPILTEGFETDKTVGIHFVGKEFLHKAEAVEPVELEYLAQRWFLRLGQKERRISSRMHARIQAGMQRISSYARYFNASPIGREQFSQNKIAKDKRELKKLLA